MSALQTQMSPENYYSLAHAQVQYDSWQEQQDDGHKGAQINHCREGFEQAMAALVNPFAETRAYTVSFAPGQNTVSPDAQRVLNEIASFISEGNHTSYQLILSGTPEQLAPVHEKLIQMNFPATRLLAGKQPVAANTVQIDLRYAVPQAENTPNI